MPFATPVQIPSARLTNASIANTIDDAVRAIDLLLATLFGVSQDTDITDFPLVRVSLLAAPSGVATLNASSQVLQHSSWENVANGVCPLDGSIKVPLANLPTGAGGGFDAASVRSLYPATDVGSTKLATLDGANKLIQRLGYEGIASGVPTLNSSVQVVERLAYEDAAGGVPKLDGSTKLKFSQFPPEVANGGFLTNGDARANYPSSRRLVAGTGITLTDSAPAGTITIAAGSASNNKVLAATYGAGAIGTQTPSSRWDPGAAFGGAGATISVPSDGYYLVTASFTVSSSSAGYGSLFISVTGTGVGGAVESQGAFGRLALCATGLLGPSASFFITIGHTGGTPAVIGGYVTVVKVG